MPQNPTYVRTLEAYSAKNGGTPAFGVSVNNTFAQAVAKMSQVAQFAFGTSATGSSSVTAITNATQLSTYFNPYQDFANGSGQNGQGPNPIISSNMGFYMPFSYSQNFVFNSNSLALTATLGSGSNMNCMSCQVVNNLYVDGVTANLFSNFVGVTASSVTTGMVVILQWQGAYYVNSVSGTTSFTLTAIPGYGSTTSPYTGNGIAFLPIYYATLNANYSGSGSGTLSFAAVPTGVSTGMYVAYNTSGGIGWYGISNVVSQTPTAVTISSVLPGSWPGTTLTSGMGIFFIPPIQTAQIWSKSYYAPQFNGIQACAFELNCQVPGSTTSRGFYVPSAQPSGPWGSWPAFWLYSGASGGLFPGDASEIDMMEMMVSSTQSYAVFSSGLHHSNFDTTPDNNNIIVRSTQNGTWNPNDYWLLDLNNSLADGNYHKFQCIWTPSVRYAYIDGQLVQSDRYAWSSGQQAQIGIDLAIGCLGAGVVNNLMFPYHTADFPMALNISNLNVWTV